MKRLSYAQTFDIQTTSSSPRRRKSFHALTEADTDFPGVTKPIRKRTQKEQDEVDEEARRKATKDLVGSWNDRLQLISLITTFLASVEAGLLQVTAPDPDDAGTTEILINASNACILSALIIHLHASFISFVGAFFLVRFKVKEAKKEEEKVEGTEPSYPQSKGSVLLDMAAKHITNSPETGSPQFGNHELNSYLNFLLMHDQQEVIKEAITSYEAALKRVDDEILPLQQSLTALLHGREGTINPVSAYEPKIRLLKAHLSSMADERSDIQHLLAVHKSLVSSIHLVPPEVWAHIFILCLPDTRYIPWDSNFSPFIFGRVCWRWRAIVLSTPKLWASISLLIPSPSEKDRRPGWIPLVHAFLNRSATVPVSLEITWHPVKYSRDEVNFEDILPDIVLCTSPRLRHLSLSLPDSCVRMFWDATMPLLETFSLRNEYKEISPPTSINAPRLHSATFDSIYLQPIEWHFSWSTLTEFISKSCYLDVQRAVHLLSWCPRLERCRMRIIPNRVDAPFSPPPIGLDEKIVMKSLKSFGIIIGSNENVFALLDALNLPVLEEMEISCATAISVASGRMRIWPKPYILALLSRSKCRLRKLVFSNIYPLYEVELRDLVERVPSLEGFDVLLEGRDALQHDIAEILHRRKS
uniref:F-box domain-containing protein n=2 Tax=Moniliophthora roreri TaxID=221103 RepID=A0A0W0FVT8_MONRR